MKKIIAFIMTAVMAMTIMACGNSEKDVIGTWVNTTKNSHGLTVILEDGNVGKVINEDSEKEFTWEIEDEKVAMVYNGMTEYLDIVEVDGKIELGMREGFYKMVPEQEYREAFEKIEITTDNWQDYFEFKDGIYVEENEFEEVNRLYYGKEFNVKEELMEKCMFVDAAIEYEAKDQVIVGVVYNVETEELTVSEPLSEAEIEDNGFFYNPSETQSGTTSFENYNMENPNGLGGYMGACNDEYEVTDSVWSWYSSVFSTYDITRIEGTIVIAK